MGKFGDIAMEFSDWKHPNINFGKMQEIGTLNGNVLSDVL